PGSTRPPWTSSRTWTPRSGGRQPAPLAARAGLAVAVAIASRMTTRRALLGAGAISLLAAGCGPEEEPKVDVQAVLAEQQRVSNAAVKAYAGVPGVGALRENAEARARRIDGALSGFTGKDTRTLEPAPEASL